jgi:hypothetical protein
MGKPGEPIVKRPPGRPRLYPDTTVKEMLALKRELRKQQPKKVQRPWKDHDEKKIAAGINNPHLARKPPKPRTYNAQTPSDMRLCKTQASRLRCLWMHVPPEALRKPLPARRLTDEDALLNFAHRSEKNPDAVELILRVCDGAKPMCTLFMRSAVINHLPETTVRNAVSALGLCFQAWFTLQGRREAVVFQEGATLAHYYDPDAVVARYASEAGVALNPAVFRAPLSSLARNVVREDFPEDVRLPMLGLCFGYPIHETIDLLSTLKAGGLAGPA